MERRPWIRSMLKEKAVGPGGNNRKKKHSQYVQSKGTEPNPHSEWSALFADR